MGISNGAVLGARYGRLHPEITRMLLINGPLMINWTQTHKGIEAYQGEQIMLVYGEMDPSFQYVPILDVIKPQCEVIVKTIPKADHVFRGTENVLLELIEEIIR